MERGVPTYDKRRFIHQFLHIFNTIWYVEILLCDTFYQTYAPPFPPPFLEKRWKWKYDMSVLSWFINGACSPLEHFWVKQLLKSQKLKLLNLEMSFHGLISLIHTFFNLNRYIKRPRNHTHFIFYSSGCWSLNILNIDIIKKGGGKGSVRLSEIANVFKLYWKYVKIGVWSTFCHM